MSATTIQAPLPFMVEGGWKWNKNNGERLRDDEGYRVRAAGVCLRSACDGTKILLVSGGKDGGRWVVPGGGVEKDEDVEEAARRELVEEAGVRTETVGQIGVFQDDDRKHRTTVYLMQVVEELKVWEDGMKGRRREWMSLEEGAERVKEGQKPILRAVMQRVCPDCCNDRINHLTHRSIFSPSNADTGSTARSERCSSSSISDRI